jgi:hypothetical protein
MYFALKHVCRLALDAGRLAKDQAQLFFERNFRPMRIAKLGDSAGYEASVLSADAALKRSGV